MENIPSTPPDHSDDQDVKMAIDLVQQKMAENNITPVNLSARIQPGFTLHRLELILKGTSYGYDENSGQKLHRYLDRFTLYQLTRLAEILGIYPDEIIALSVPIKKDPIKGINLNYRVDHLILQAAMRIVAIPECHFKRMIISMISKKSETNGRN